MRVKIGLRINFAVMQTSNSGKLIKIIINVKNGQNFAKTKKDHNFFYI